MRGAGKTAVCSVLQRVIGGEHIHYDELNSHRLGQKQAYERRSA